MKMVCPNWIKRECKSEICPHSGVHEELSNQFGDVCRDVPVSKFCTACIECGSGTSKMPFKEKK